MNNIYDEELQKMKDTLSTMDDQLEQLENIPVYHGDNLKEQVLESMRESKSDKNYELVYRSHTLESVRF